MAMAEKIKIVLLKQKRTVKDLSIALGCSSQNLSGKFNRDNFSERELEDIANALNCKLNMSFILETGEEV